MINLNAPGRFRPRSEEVSVRNTFARALFALALAARPLEAAGHLDLQVQGGRVSLDAQAATVQEILDALAARKIVRVTMDEAASFRARLTTVNKRFGKRELDVALDSILIEIPHELVRGPDGAVAEVRLISPLAHRGAAQATVQQVVPSKAAVRAGRDVAAGVVPATALPPVTSSAFSLEAAPVAGSLAPANALATRIAGRRAAINARAGLAAHAGTGAGGPPPEPAAPADGHKHASLPTPAPGGDMPGAPPTLSTAAVVAAAPKRVSNRPPIATPNPLEVPASPYRIGGMEMPSLASADEKAGFRADRAAGKVGGR